MIVDLAILSISSQSSCFMALGFTPCELYWLELLLLHQDVHNLRLPTREVGTIQVLDVEKRSRFIMRRCHRLSLPLTKNPQKKSNRVFFVRWDLDNQETSDFSLFYLHMRLSKNFGRVFFVNRALKHQKPSDIRLFLSYQLSTRSIWHSLAAPTVNQCN